MRTEPSLRLSTAAVTVTGVFLLGAAVGFWFGKPVIGGLILLWAATPLIRPLGWRPRLPSYRL